MLQLRTSRGSTDLHGRVLSPLLTVGQRSGLLHEASMKYGYKSVFIHVFNSPYIMVLVVIVGRRSTSPMKCQTLSAAVGCWVTCFHGAKGACRGKKVHTIVLIRNKLLGITTSLITRRFKRTESTLCGEKGCCVQHIHHMGKHC